jgi:hypothetical protein
MALVCEDLDSHYAGLRDDYSFASGPSSATSRGLIHWFSTGPATAHAATLRPLLPLPLHHKRSTSPFFLIALGQPGRVVASAEVWG